MPFKKKLARTAFEKAAATLHNAVLEDVEPCTWHKCRAPVDRALATTLSKEEVQLLGPNAIGAPTGPTCVSMKGALKYFCGIQCQYNYGQYLSGPLKPALLGIMVAFGSVIATVILTIVLSIFSIEPPGAVVAGTGYVVLAAIALGMLTCCLGFLVFIFRILRP